MVNREKVLTRQLITKWYERARIDYSDLYVKEYIAYNAWFRKVTNCNVDHEAIKEVCQRFVIWDDYINGRTLISLGSVVDQIALLTQQHPVLPVGIIWNGVVKDSMDWRSLIYFWYQTRCELFHGLTMPGSPYHDLQIRLAYESLSIFMAEIIKRMRYCFTDTDFARLTDVQTLLQSENGATSELKEIEVSLHQKFIHSPDLWNVDMERA
jgi:hypothetical protein